MPTVIVQLAGVLLLQPSNPPLAMMFRPAVPVGLWQGLLTLLAVGLGTFMSSAVIASITVTGGILMLGIGLRVLNIRQINVGNLLPALIVAPLITIALAAIRGTL